MKPANFEFARAATLAEAAAILRQADGAKVVAGGQSLGPMLNLRMATVREQLGSTYGTYAGRSVRRGPTAYVMGGSIDAER